MVSLQKRNNGQRPFGGRIDRSIIGLPTHRPVQLRRIITTPIGESFTPLQERVMWEMPGDEGYEYFDYAPGMVRAK